MGGIGGMEFMIDDNGLPKFLAIDKGGQNVNVGSRLSDFAIVRSLGEGHFGSVKLVKSNITNKLYAMKEIKASRYQSEKQRQAVEKEIKLLENLHHPNVITYFKSFKENGNFYIIIQYINGGSLEDLLIDNIKQNRRIAEKRIWDLLVQSLSGLLYLHEKKKIIQRDIKPDNLLLDSEGRLKISDFGVSAIQSDNVDEALKCHYTVAGPIQFMAPEVALGDIYDFKSDIYMLGLTFFFLMSNQLPEKKITLGPLIIPVKNPNAKLPECYSLKLRQFVEKLLKPVDQRPSASVAYYEALDYYNSKYLRTTSICSTLLCLFSIPTINKYFKGESINKRLREDEENGTENYIITKTFKETFYSLDPMKFNAGKARLECLKLRLILYSDNERLEHSEELELYNYIAHLLLKLHKELNRFKGQQLRDSSQIDETNENAVLEREVKRFTTYYKSKISDEFYYLTKVTDSCPDCGNVIRYFCGINSLCAMYPERTALYLKKKDISIIDMLRHYRKSRLFTNSDAHCNYCKKDINKVYRQKIFYTSPFNFILEISYEKEDSFKLTINEKLSMNEFIERKDVSNSFYILVGAIFLENGNNEDKYESISRINNGWVYYNGNTIKNCTFNDLLNHKHLKMLFYSSNYN
jgi:serine/threonine protein kinase